MRKKIAQLRISSLRIFVVISYCKLKLVLFFNIKFLAF